MRLPTSIVGIAATLGALMVLCLVILHFPANGAVSEHSLAFGGTDGLVSAAPAATHSELEAQQITTDQGVRHSRISLALGVAEQVWPIIVLAIILFGGLAPRLNSAAQAVTRGKLGTTLPFILLLVGILVVSGMPISFYQGYVVEHQFGLSNQSVASWLSDTGINLVLALLAVAIFFVPAYWIIRRSPRRWWLYLSGMLVAITIIVSALMPVLIEPLFNNFQPLQDQQLKERIMALADRAHMQVTGIVQEDASTRTQTANAYVSGLGPYKRIVLDDTLLSKFTQDEIVTVVAHEMGHQAHQDIWRGIAVSVFIYLAGVYFTYRAGLWLLCRQGARFGFTRFQDAASLSLLLFLLGGFIVLTQPIDNTASRYIEHEADRYSLDLTHDNKDFASALQKLGEVNLSDPNPPNWVEFLFYTHPSISHRIQFTETYHPQ